MVEGKSVSAVGGGSPVFRDAVELENVLRIEVCTVTHKVGLINKTKSMERRSWDEEEFLEDMVTWAKFSGMRPNDPFFSREVRRPTGAKKLSFKKCTGKMVTEAIKRAVTQEGMDPKYFSFHSLRKGCITQMKALHMSKE